ncbi:hypothetical protein DFH09DRAFT_1303013 [Mycena vulgaris]|nr:hypothetical protein DFH09DRAFT_1303013 [Mycena vulgaris]
MNVSESETPLGPLLAFADIPNRRGKVGRPNKHTDRLRWIAHFEQEITAKYAAPPPPFQDTPRSDWLRKTAEIADLNQGIAQLAKEIMGQEGLLIARAIESLEGNFETEWKELDVTKKKEFALEGLYRGACSAQHPNSRILCPEMIVDGLLNRIIGHDPSGNRRVKTLSLFVHPHVEQEARYSEGSPDFFEAWLYRAVLLRHAYIVGALVGILEAYHNISPMMMRNAMLSDTIHIEERTRDKKFLRGTIKNLSNKYQFKEAATCFYACYSLLLQNDEWKAHKRFCGKENIDQEVVATDPEKPDDFIGCPKAVQGLTVLVVRRRAMPSGSLSAVYMMLSIVDRESAQREGSLGLTLEQVRRQFETEYRVSTAEAARRAADEFTSPTAQEPEEEWPYLQQRMARAASLGMY